jgi:hypothetical protein
MTRTPEKRRKPRSAVTSVAPYSIDKAARNASSMSLPRSFNFAQRPLRISRCCSPGSIRRTMGCSLSAPSARNRGVRSCFLHRQPALSLSVRPSPGIAHAFAGRSASDPLLARSRTTPNEARVRSCFLHRELALSLPRQLKFRCSRFAGSHETVGSGLVSCIPTPLSQFPFNHTKR